MLITPTAAAAAAADRLKLISEAKLDPRQDSIPELSMIKEQAAKREVEKRRKFQVQFATRFELPTTKYARERRGDDVVDQNRQSRYAFQRKDQKGDLRLQDIEESIRNLPVQLDQHELMLQCAEILANLDNDIEALHRGTVEWMKQEEQYDEERTSDAGTIMGRHMETVRRRRNQPVVTIGEASFPYCELFNTVCVE